jgi:hypothetical protein
MIGQLMQWLGLPGLVSPFRYRDDAAGLDVSVRTSPRYTILTVNGTEFFFWRENGHFDGVGMMSLEAEPISHCTAARIRRLADVRELGESARL